MLGSSMSAMIGLKTCALLLRQRIAKQQNGSPVALPCRYGHYIEGCHFPSERGLAALAEALLVFCSRTHAACFGPPKAQSQVVYFDDLVGQPHWCTRVWSFAKEFSEGLVVLCLVGSGLCRPMPSNPIRAATFRKTSCAMTFAQDSVLLPIELWLHAYRAAAVFPCHEPTIEATIKRLPGISWRKSRDLLRESHIPEALFHVL